MEYEFKVGDYVETCFGEVGYIYMICGNNAYFKDKNEEIPHIFFMDAKKDYYILNFNRIGKYDFTKKEKIKSLEIIKEKYDQYYNGVFIKHLPDSNRLPNNKELMDKINEIIEYINKEE